MEAARVQHISKASSDQLLRKFAEVGSESVTDVSTRKAIGAAKSRRRCRKNVEGDRWVGHSSQNDSKGGCANSTLVERKSLLPPASRRTGLLRQLGIAKSQLRARDFKNKSLVATIEKTWRKAVAGASRVFIERHYNRHKRLINDAFVAS
ncbi:hypothetical protein Ancab_013743 [Ancistrocladus abbreviatus]